MVKLNGFSHRTSKVSSSLVKLLSDIKPCLLCGSSFGVSGMGITAGDARGDSGKEAVAVMNVCSVDLLAEPAADIVALQNDLE
jgi:hypothetical protein